MIKRSNGYLELDLNIKIKDVTNMSNPHIVETYVANFSEQRRWYPSADSFMIFIIFIAIFLIIFLYIRFVENRLILFKNRVISFVRMKINIK